jgi:hypothetical protein
MPPVHYQRAVARAVQRIRASGLEKVVLARKVEVHALVDHDPGAVIGILREAFGSCFAFAVRRGGATFVAATPSCSSAVRDSEPSTVALAGSARRSADPAGDDHRGERLLRSDKEREEKPDRRPPDRPGGGTPVGVGDRRTGNVGGAGGEHPAPGLVDPRAVGLSGGCDRTRRPTASHLGRARGAGKRGGIAVLEGLDRGWYAGRSVDRLHRGPGVLPWRCGAGCCAAASRAATPATGSCGIPILSLSSWNPRSSWRRCWRAEAARPGRADSGACSQMSGVDNCCPSGPGAAGSHVRKTSASSRMSPNVNPLSSSGFWSSISTRITARYAIRARVSVLG